MREFVPLRAVESSATRKVPASFEFRTFWWRGECVGEGAYYAETAQYQWDRIERVKALSLAKEVVRRVDVTFLVVDLAQTATGEWIVIELNDGQESGYAGIAPIGLWQKVVDIERRERGGS